MILYLFVFILCTYSVIGQELSTVNENNFEIRRANMIVDIITLNLKKNGWSTILCIGNLPNEFYRKMQGISYSIAIINNIDHEYEDIDNVIQYYANTIVIDLQNIAQYEAKIFKALASPYWHPLANIIIYYHELEREILPKMYFSLWYYKAVNAIIVQYNDTEEALFLSHYSPYISDDYKLDYLYGCWTTRRIGMPVSGFDEGFTCEEKCHNVSLHSKLRANNLGTCIGFRIISIPYNFFPIMADNLFEDKGANLHGFSFRAYATEIKPFLLIDDNGNGSYALHARDGMIWTAMAKLMNFRISLTPNITIIKEPFNYELTITNIFQFATRKIDLCLMPMYLFDLIVVEVDYSIPYTDSGVCFVAHRAGFERKLFNIKSFHGSRNFIAKFFICFICIWMTFSIYHWVEKGHITFDQIGKDLLNTFRNVLLVTPHNPPRHRFFRPFLTISMWGFFAFNFASQATITSFLAAEKRGKEVNTFKDIIDKGYLIYGIASPDLMDPDADENFRTITSKIIHMHDPFECVKEMSHDGRRFCLIDCTVGRYLERNRLNDKGEQYLHITQDRMHSHYLIAMLTKHSPLTERFNKYLTMFYEAGLIKKWEQYRFNRIKKDASMRALGMNDYQSLFNTYCYSLGFICIIFGLEWLLFHIKMVLKTYVFKRTYVPNNN